jgi:hypothetical protein
MTIAWEDLASFAALIGVYGPIFTVAVRYPRKYKSDFQFVFAVLIGIICAATFHVCVMNLEIIASLLETYGKRAGGPGGLTPTELKEVMSNIDNLHFYNQCLKYTYWLALSAVALLPLAWKIADWEEKKAVETGGSKPPSSTIKVP